MKVQVKLNVFHTRHGQYCELDETIKEHLGVDLAALPQLVMEILLSEEFNKGSDDIQVQLAEEK